MAEGEEGGAKVRVVRCPKCDKLLPELANFTVYRCGGCDATLQANKQPSVFEASLEKSDGELSRYSDKSSEVDAESDQVEFRKEEPSLNKACGESLVTENGKTDALKEGESPRLESLPASKAEVIDGKFQCPSNGASLYHSDDHVDGSGKRKLKEDHEAKAQIFCSIGHSKVRQTEACEGEDLNSVQVFQATAMAPIADARAASYPDASPSSYNPNLNHIYAEGAAKKNIEGPERVELLEQDRSELLRKLDELRDQLKRSCEVGEAPPKRVPLNGMAASSSSYGDNGGGRWFPDGPSTMNRNPSQHSSFFNGSSVSQHPPFFNASNVSQHSPFFNGNNVDIPQCNPAANMQNGVNGYREASRSYSLAPFHHHGHYPQRSFNNYMYGQLDPDPVTLFHNDGFYHQPACACMHCYNGHWLPPAQVPPAVLSNPRIPPYPLGSHNFYAVDGPSVFGSQGYNHRVPKAPLHSCEPHSQLKTTFINKERRPCRPVAGAAPFIVCYNCSELLQIPEQILQMGKHQHKLQCGSCSHLISFELDGRRLISSNNVSNLQAHNENNINSIGGAKDVLQCHGNMNRRQVISYSVDYDSPSYYDGRSADEKIVMPSFPISSNETVEKECGQNLSDSGKLHGICSSSSTSDGVESPDSVICQRDIPSSAELPTEGDAITRVPSLPLREHFGYPSDNQLVDDPGSGSRSKRSDQERVISLKENFKQNSVKDVPVATEMDFSAEDYPNAGFSQDSWDVSKDEEDPRTSKGGESFLTGLIKKSFRDFSRFNQSTENGRYRVSVNGHPISDRLVKKAEKLAGPIHPGDYWYDYRAGFWGVMGHACLGIIPPFIEEFNYPMRRNCAAGNTGVMVNGRELHEKDLTLLASRGLPVIEGHSYIIEISGKVWDEETGEEHDSLGKLAPTVERVKRGFGMRVPRVAA